MDLLVSASKPEPKPPFTSRLEPLHHLEYAFTLNGPKASCFRGFKSVPSSRISNQDNSPMNNFKFLGFTLNPPFSPSDGLISGSLHQGDALATELTLSNFLSITSSN
ncbi:hypothetical protein COLO4_04344 [Corchorus olitorius]|uniref:Uncharacterized protein n=1 Tax=Corchorus olitorius TaxID=93759 RepID=A0A1R3KUC7_9ROSI|nr:hypothetical protein COLO4_04344 [Corchorus olitorius]